MTINRVLHRLETQSSDPWVSHDEYWEKAEAIWFLRFLRTLPDCEADKIPAYLKTRGIGRTWTVADAAKSAMLAEF